MRELVIDVSKWDGNVDFNAWKNNRGLWGVIIKAGGNENGIGKYTDSKFEQNYNNAKAAGLHVGAYYYTTSTDTGNAKEDAKHFCSILQGKKFDLPVFIDIEDAGQAQLSKRVLTDIVKTFCDYVNSQGYYGGVYTSGSWWLNNVYSKELDSYANWIAAWAASWPTYAANAGMWQQGGIRLSDGDIVYDDVSGYTDCNWCVIDYPGRIAGGGSSADTKDKWVEKNGKWWYRHRDGSFTTDNWEKIDGEWYYFDKAGWMVTGWLKDPKSGQWYFMNDTPGSGKFGRMERNIIVPWASKNGWCIIGPDGICVENGNFKVKDWLIQFS